MKELNAAFKAKNKMKIGDTIFEKDQPIFYIDIVASSVKNAAVNVHTEGCYEIINKLIAQTAQECQIKSAKEKDKLMRNLMPKVKGMADEEFINKLVTGYVNNLL